MTTDWHAAFRAFNAHGLRVRRAHQSDSPSVLHLSREGLRPYVEAVWGWDDTDQRRRHDEWWCPSNILIFERGGEVVAFLHITETDGAFDIGRLVVNAELRGRGTGSAIVRRVQDVARTEDRDVVLQVIDGNPAVRLYERLGFTRTHVDGPKTHMRWSPTIDHCSFSTASGRFG